MLPALEAAEEASNLSAECHRSHRQRRNRSSSGHQQQHQHQRLIDYHTTRSSNDQTRDNEQQDQQVDHVKQQLLGRNYLSERTKLTHSQIDSMAYCHERLPSCTHESTKQEPEEPSERCRSRDDRDVLLRHPRLEPHQLATQANQPLARHHRPAQVAGAQHEHSPMETSASTSASTRKSKSSSSSSSSSHPVAISSSSLPSIIVCISVALLVLISRTSAVSKQPTQSIQQLVRSADVELNRRGLQRSQREASASLVVGANSTTSLMGAATCGYPGSPAHASVTFNTSHVVAGTAASYTCDNGYELLGPPRRICQANGTWSPIGIPFCVLNVGLGKAAMQSSTAGHGSAQKAVDGSTSPYFQASTCTMTDVENNPWWYVNLLEPYLVQIVRIDFGTACCANRQKATVAVRVGNNRPDLGTNPLCNRYHGFIEEGKPLFLPCTRPAPGAFVSIHLESPSGSALSICETFIYTDHALSIEQCPSFRDQPLGSTATYNGKCYLFHNNQVLNFDSARKYCESRGGTLVDETSPALQGFLSWELYRRHRNDQLMGQYWLGAVRDTRNTQNWKWINGRDVQISFWNSLANQGNCSRFDGSKGWLWSDTDCQAQLNFICQYRPLSCGKPEKPTNSTLITKNIDNGTVIEYQCAPGNLLMGPKSRVCLPTGFFSEFAPKCKYLDCQFPAMIANGDYKLLNGTTAYQSVVTYYCNDGYQLYGRPTLSCDVDERWNGPPPRCEPLLCPAPVAPSNGYVTVTSNITVPGTQATYDCRPGYDLVGERLLSCLQSGSWDQSFPYCREKRHLLPHALGDGQTKPLAAATSEATNAAPVLANKQTNPLAATTTNGSSNGSRQQTTAVQFPNSATSFSSNRVVPTLSPGSTASTTAAAAPSSTTPASNSPASLNGLAGQQQQQQQPHPVAPQTNSQQPPLPVSLNEISSSTGNVGGTPPNVIEHQQNSRKPAQSSSISSFVQSPPAAPSQPVPPQSPNGSGSTDFEQTSPPTQQQRGPSRQQSPVPSRSSSPVNQRPHSSPTSNNRFTFNPISSSTNFGNGASTSAGHFDSSPLATTNSISVHQQQNQATPTTGQPPAISSDGSPVGFGGSTTSSATLSSTTAGLQTSPSTSHSSLGGLHATSNGPSLLSGGFSQPPIRASSHNSLANAKNSLDGIIAVAIFGGFIFLGAIITILVIIIRRRKSSHSSVIDAQTISTYDSNQEHNGLYRNYQQAWENLRFSAPNSQPKSSGNGPGGGGAGGGGMGVGASIGAPTSMALKSYAAPNVAILHHAHPIHATGGIHHNIGMGASSTTSSSSHTSSSAGNSGGDPLLGSRHNLHHFHQHAHHAATAHQLMATRHQHRHHEEDVMDEEDEEEQGIVTEDEAPYNHQLHAGRLQHRGSHHYTPHNSSGGHLNEGFRDTNELTINADTATASGQAMSRSMAAAHRRSTNNLSSTGNGAHHQGGGQRQSTTSSSSAVQSSRASPDELDRLAYGNNWPSAAGGSASQLMR